MKSATAVAGIKKKDLLLMLLPRQPPLMPFAAAAGNYNKFYITTNFPGQ
jgi:hypothetical protein